MPWWAWLLTIALSVLLFFGLLLMLLPLRISGCYLRENKTDRLDLRLKWGIFGLNYEQRVDDGGAGTGRLHLLIGRFSPAGFPLKGLLPEIGEGGAWWERLLHRGERTRFLGVFRQARPLLKKITWSRFDLELSWGWGDPAWTALAAGGVWAAGGVITGLLHQYFSVAARPRVEVLPLWSPAGLRLSWQGELSLSLHSGLQLWRLTKIEEV